MAKKYFRDEPIPEIPQDEAILKEGIVHTLTVISGNSRRTIFKYALTEKGVWMRNKRFLWIKPRASFLPYSDIASYKHSKHFNLDTLVFFLKNGKKPSNRIIFDDLASAEAILARYITQMPK